MNECVLFVQKKPHKAGAQTCLARLLQSDAIRKWNPVVLTGSEGWLTKECARIGIRTVVEAFPGSRAVQSRLIWNRLFARRVSLRLREEGLRPVIVQANDHPEGILALLVAARFGARTSMLLRSPGMTESAYFRYRCDEYDAVSAIGENLTNRVRQWDLKADAQLTFDGLLDEEFLPPKRLAETAPSKILVVGSPLVWKGWRDLVDAALLLEERGSYPSLTFDFTGREPHASTNDLGLERLKRTQFRFLGRVEKFRELTLEYDLVVNPSRMETFGMAALETLAAGIPVLSSRCGVIEHVQTKSEMLFTAGDAKTLADRLEAVLSGWSGIDFDMPAIQKNIRDKFHLERAAQQLDGMYSGLAKAR